MSKPFYKYDETTEIVEKNGGFKLKHPLKNGGEKHIKPYQELKEKTKNIGVILRNIIVVDIDVDHRDGVDGKRSLQKWVNRRSDKDKIIEDVTHTLKVVTPGKGIHIHFALPNELTSDDFKRIVNPNLGIDILIGKYNHAPLPGTVRSDGAYKQFDDIDTPLTAPKWLFDLIEYVDGNNNNNKETKDSVRNQKVEGRYSVKHDTPPLERIIQAMIYGFEKGERNNEMASLIGTLKWYIENDKISHEMAVELVLFVGRQCQPALDENEISNIWNSIVDY
ncbi:bifunctional DNA primase/polymerase [Staphylococcus epidermidis]|uniref:bifunctional DNA primase/polymerase n=1 Tax=Staphylococcus epidermidis TaxID=1282 RepID=UPI00119F1B9E|nr:bifunctional DNA primase/polymerase [Staphylococcus epidermidis]